MQIESKNPALLEKIKQMLSIRIGLDKDAIDDAILHQALYLMREKVGILDDFVPLCEYFFQPVDYSTPKAQAMHAKVWEADTCEILEFVAEQWQHARSFDAQDISRALKLAQKKFKKKGLKSYVSIY